jgi:hypothetical protein
MCIAQVQSVRIRDLAKRPGALAILRRAYCTMIVTVVECDSVPEVAVTVKGKDCGVKVS